MRKSNPITSALAAVLTVTATQAQVPAGIDGAADRQATIRLIMTRNDADKNGIITREEAVTANQRLIAGWDTYDLNKDDKVDAAELHEALAARPAPARSAPRVDHEEDVDVELPEVLVCCQRLASEKTSAVDATEQGSISHAETVVEFAVRRLSEDPSGNAAKCAAEVPSMKKDLDRAMSERRSRIDAIAKALVTEARFESANRDSVSVDVVAFYRYMDGERAPIYVGTDAKRYCEGILKELRESHGKLLASQLEQVIATIQDNMAIFKNANQ